MRRCSALLLVLFSGCSQSPTTARTLSLKEGLAQAKERNCNVLLVFSATWCGPCHMLEDTTFSDGAVKERMRELVEVHLDVDKNSDVAKHYDVELIPAYLMLSPTGE